MDTKFSVERLDKDKHLKKKKEKTKKKCVKNHEWADKKMV